MIRCSEIRRSYSLSSLVFMLLRIYEIRTIRKERVRISYQLMTFLIKRSPPFPSTFLNGTYIENVLIFNLIHLFTERVTKDLISCRRDF